jgi:hypothetical protein
MKLGSSVFRGPRHRMVVVHTPRGTCRRLAANSRHPTLCEKRPRDRPSRGTTRRSAIRRRGGARGQTRGMAVAVGDWRTRPAQTLGEPPEMAPNCEFRARHPLRKPRRVHDSRIRHTKSAARSRTAAAKHVSAYLSYCVSSGENSSAGHALQLDAARARDRRARACVNVAHDIMCACLSRAVPAAPPAAPR